MTQTISFLNMKGGVGKTTLCVNIGYALAYEHGKKVLLVDVDPQSNASSYLMSGIDYFKHIKNDRKRSVLDIFIPDRIGHISTVSGVKEKSKKGSFSLESFIYNVNDKNGKFDLIPSTLQLMEIENSQRGTESRLNNFLKEKCSTYDYVLIDCPPTISIFTYAAILSSNKYLVPIKPDPLSTIGLPLLEKWLKERADLAGTKKDSVGIVFCMVRSPLPNAMNDVMKDLREKREDEVFENHLTLSTRVAESVEKNEPIFLYDKNSKWAKETMLITSEFLERIEGE